MYSLEVNNAYTPYNNPAKKCDTLIDDGTKGLLQADFWASSQNNNIIYFSKEHEIRSCNIDANYVEKNQRTLPSGETVTYMRHLKTSDGKVNKLAVATFDGSRYKVYLYDIQAGNLRNDPEILEGEGRVGAMIYINGMTKQRFINPYSMKNYLFILLLCLALPGCAQEYSTIKGFVKGAGLKEVTLYKTVDGSPQVYATSRVGADGSYGFLLNPEPGFYSIGEERLNFPVYLKGGEEVNIDLLETRAGLNGKNTKENKALYLWADYAADIRLKSVFFERTLSNYEDFFPEFEAYVAGLDELKNRLKSGNKAFDALLAEYVNYATDYYAVIFLYTPRTKHPEKSMRPDYYRHIVSEDKFTDDGVLQFPDGVRMLSSYVSFAQEENDLKYGDAQYTENSLSYLPDNRLKGEYLISSVFRNFKSYGQYLSAMEQYGKYLVTPSLKERAEAVGTKLYDTKPGGRAADFTYPDTGGKMVSLSDFKGKVVLVDVWATWCGPCRQQIPYLKKLEEELHGEDIVFLGVSVDESKDKQKWLDFIEKEDLKGVQLLAGGWSKITKDYKINGIPRFMVFDKQGNIVSVDAPRPSSPELKRMLETELKK